MENQPEIQNVSDQKILGTQRIHRWQDHEGADKVLNKQKHKVHLVTSYGHEKVFNPLIPLQDFTKLHGFLFCARDCGTLVLIGLPWADLTYFLSHLQAQILFSIVSGVPGLRTTIHLS